MDNIFLKSIKVNRDAPHVNRGFYFQYLTVLKKWIDNYISGKDVLIYTEVGNDIKEVGCQLVYTQVKCFTSSFSFKSTSLKKEILGFFLQYLEEKDVNPELEFHFFTNTSIKKSETLLQDWVRLQPLKDGELKEQCSSKIKEILLDQLSKLFNSHVTQSGLTSNEKESLEASYQELKDILDLEYDTFTSKLKWFFGNDTPELSVISLHSEILHALEHDKFNGKPPSIILEALLSEIYRRSQLELPQERKVDNQLLSDMLCSKDQELNKYINTLLIDLLEVRFYTIHKQIQDLQASQEQHTLKIISNEEKIAGILKRQQSGLDSVPKNLTSIPHINPEDIFGRNTGVDIIDRLLKANKCLLVNGGGGMGKSLLSRLYGQLHYDDFTHMIWIDCELGIREGFIMNEILSHRLKIDDNIAPDKKFNAIIGKLEALNSGGLIVLDNLQDETGSLEIIKGLKNWYSIVTSRQRIPGLAVHEVERLSFSAARALYKKFEPERPATDTQLSALFEYIDYNTLTIELIAKTIHLSFDLTVETFFNYLQNQQLDQDNLDIDIEPGLNSRLLFVLNKTFDISKLSGQERYYIEFFALLPSEGITLQDLVAWYGKKFENENKIEFARAVNSLHRKGLIKRSGSHIKMDKIFQESVRYQSRKALNPYFSQLFHVNFLATRLKEGIEGDPQQALHFLKYAQSFLKNIQEPFRRCLYQPLLLMENEALYITSWLDGAKVVLPLWEDLAKRAEAVLGKEDPLVGTISNNFALALFGEGKLQEAAKYFDTAIAIFKITQISPGSLLYMMSNRAHIYLSENDIKGFGRIFEEMTEIRQANSLWDDPSFPIQCHSLATAHLSARDLQAAKDMYALAIISHKKLPPEKRNDLNLISFLCDMAYCCFALKKFELAEKAAVEATHHLHKLQINKGQPMIKVLEILIILANHHGDATNEKKLKEVLQSQLNDD